MVFNMHDKVRVTRKNTHFVGEVVSIPAAPAGFAEIQLHNGDTICGPVTYCFGQTQDCGALLDELDTPGTFKRWAVEFGGVSFMFEENDDGIVIEGSISGNEVKSFITWLKAEHGRYVIEQRLLADCIDGCE